MTQTRTEVPTEVRKMVTRTANRIDGTDPAHLFEAPLPSAYVTAMPERRRHRRIPAALVAAAVVAVAIAGAALREDPLQQDTATTASRPAQEPPARLVDIFDGALIDIDGPVALPAALPPGLEWVFLMAVNGQQNFTAQSGDILIGVCPADTCSRNAQKILRSFEFDGAPFEVVQYSAKKIPPLDLPPLPEEYLDFWQSVEFVGHRPDWLRAEHTPGGV